MPGSPSAPTNLLPRPLARSSSWNASPWLALIFKAFPAHNKEASRDLQDAFKNLNQLSSRKPASGRNSVRREKLGRLEALTKKEVELMSKLVQTRNSEGPESAATLVQSREADNNMN